MPSHSIQAQNSLFEKLEIGASVNYSSLHYESSDGDFINDVISYDFGFQIHALTNFDFSQNFSLQTGLEYFFFTYDIEELTIQETDINRNPTGNYLKAYIGKKDFNTTYLSLPIRLRYSPLSRSQFYITAGPEFSYKIGYKNGEYKNILYSENDEQLQEMSFTYDVPEAANNFLISGVAGMGYNFRSIAPIKLEVKAKHSITPYLSGDNSTKSWVRSLSFSVSYSI